jgi:hypothetical protein
MIKYCKTYYYVMIILLYINTVDKEKIDFKGVLYRQFQLRS